VRCFHKGEQAHIVISERYGYDGNLNQLVVRMPTAIYLEDAIYV
jgi:hypothetical protein